MKRRGKSAIELFEEAVYLLKHAPAALGAYYTGSLPFVLGFLFFWSDMSQSAFAYEHCAPAALGLAALFSWMMYWQAIFVRKLHADVLGVPALEWSSSEARGLGFLQIAFQPTKFLLIPVAALALLPFASTYAFYQNLMAIPDSEAESVARFFSAARKGAVLWQSQNWTLLAILGMLEVVVFLNIGAALILGPYLVKLLLGIENVFTRSGISSMNTTFLAITAGLTYLVMNPFAKAVYLLRYFYAKSVETGEDLRIAQAFLPVLALLFIPTCVIAQTAPPAPVISGEQLNRAIDEVIHRPEFTWRLPRPLRPPANNRNWFIRATEYFLDAIARGGRQIGHWLDEFLHWLGEKLKSMLPGLGGNQPGLDSWKLRALLYVLLAAVGALLGWLLWRVLRSKKKAQDAAAIPVAAPVFELSDPDLQVDQQKLDQWLQLARDCMARQELRLALRALYLAGLAYLGERSLIAIQRGKSNQDYARELRRKARATPELLTFFAQNMAIFERTWYGMQTVDSGTLEQFESNLAKMRSCATQ